MSRTVRRKKKNIKERLLFPVCLLLLIAGIACPIGMRSIDLREQEQAYIEKESRLNEEIEAEMKRTKELEEKKKYVGTKQYIEEVARDRLGLIAPDEVLIQAENAR